MMGSSLQFFSPFSHIGNVCPISNFCLANQGPSLVDMEGNTQYRRFDQRDKCEKCCTSSGTCTSDTKCCSAPMCLVDYGIPCSTTEYYPGLNFPDIDRSHVGNVPYGKRITSCTVKGTVALTYDDGPCQWSSDILDVLKKNNVKATFFVIGWKTCRGSEDHSPAEFASIIRRMYNEGHQIASHTFTHTSMDEKTTEDRIKDMVKMELVLGDILGFVPTYWRPPFGACYTKQCQTDLGALGYHSIFWDFDPRDWEGNYTYAENQFLSHFATGNPSNLSALPVMHETHKRTVHEFTQWAIDLAHEKGYKLARVGECMGDPEENWYRSTTAAMGVRGL